MIGLARPVEVTPGFRPGDRHGALNKICSAIEDLLLATSAAEILATGDVPLSGALAVLPCWTWVVPGECVGRKGRTRDGSSTLLLPARTTYDAGPLVLLADGEQVSVPWAYLGSGVSGRAVLTLSTTFGTRPDLLSPHAAGDLPAHGEVTVMTRRNLLRRLTQLVERGTVAHWELLIYLERYVERAVQAAHNTVVAEVNDVGSANYRIQTRFDEIQLDGIASYLTYGADGDPGPSVLSRMITKIATPGTLTKAEPLRYLTINLRRDAEAEIRKRLGDPHIGPKIRRVARSMPGASKDAILIAYRELYPRDRAGEARVLDALTVPKNTHVHFDDPHLDALRATYGYSSADHADSVIERIDLARAVARRTRRPAPVATQLLPAPEHLAVAL
jgi:hypothetical protein